ESEPTPKRMYNDRKLSEKIDRYPSTTTNTAYAIGRASANEPRPTIVRKKSKSKNTNIINPTTATLPRARIESWRTAEFSSCPNKSPVFHVTTSPRDAAVEDFR